MSLPSLSFAFAFRDDNTLIFNSRSVPPTINQTIAYTYDHLYRLTVATYATGAFYQYFWDAPP